MRRGSPSSRERRDGRAHRNRARPRSEFHRLWGADSTPHYPDQGALPPHLTYFPPLGASGSILHHSAPDQRCARRRPDVERAFAEAEEKLPGLLGHMEPENPGFHRTDTIDMLYVASGQIVLSLDDGAEVTLSAGDTVVQNGTRHAWRNPGLSPP